jgi:hypothetical protein
MWHLVSGGTLVSSFACRDHKDDARRFNHRAIHPIGPDCGMPGAVYYPHPINQCRCDGGIEEAVSDIQEEEILVG